MQQVKKTIKRFETGLSGNRETATALRVGLGLVFIIGGISKLSQLLDPNRMAAIVGNYTGGKGYIFPHR